MLTLYYSPGACSLAAHIVLEELGLPYEAKLVSLKEGAHKQPAYLAINPRGKVPALRLEGGEVLTENVAILSYLAGLAPALGLLPNDPLPRARTMELLGFLASGAHPAFSRLYAPARFSAEPSHGDAIREVGRRDFQGALELYDAMLSPTGPFAIGERYTVADAFTHVFYTWAKAFELDLTTLPRMRRISAAVSQRPAAKRAMIAEGLIAA